MTNDTRQKMKISNGEQYIKALKNRDDTEKSMQAAQAIVDSFMDEYNEINSAIEQYEQEQAALDE